MRHVSLHTCHHMNTRVSISALVVSLFLVGLLGCNGDNGLADAYGNFESDDVIVSAEASGRLLRFGADEGDRLGSGVVVAVVDTTQLVLERAQLVAQRRAIRARMPGVVAQVDVLQEQRDIALRDRERLKNLVAEGAATQKQLDDVDGQLRVLDRQMASVRTQNPPLVAELDVVSTRLAQIDDRIARSTVVNPVEGTVLLTYAEQSELTGAGQPLYKIAPLDTVYLRAYISGAQLSRIAIGQEVTVAIDRDATSESNLTGIVTWVSDQAEFTPKLIQTKEERVNLVYAFKVRVANPDGRIKLGMPGEVWLSNEAND